MGRVLNYEGQHKGDFSPRQQGLEIAHKDIWGNVILISGQRVSCHIKHSAQRRNSLQGGKVLSFSTIIFYYLLIFLLSADIMWFAQEKSNGEDSLGWAFPIKANSAARTNQSLEWASSWWGLDRLLVLQCDTFFSPIYLSIVSFILISSFTSKISIFRIGSRNETP